jgi:hypothetical protein
MRSKGDKNTLLMLINNILWCNKSTSGDYFASNYMVDCQINMNKNLIFKQAKKAKVTKKTLDSTINLPQINLTNEINIGNLDDLQKAVLALFQEIIDAKTISEQELLDLERRMFIELSKKPECLEKLAKI